MKIKDFILAVILLFVARGFAFADRQLDRAEILQIFKTLTDQPRKTWIPSGVIEATHLAYKASSGYMTDSTVIVKYDGDKFYWEININSHTKETEPRGPSRHDFDLNWNKKRVFAWDGERYTMYFRPGNSANVTETPSDIPVTVNGPLTAGIVPWGYGAYTLESLSTAESSGEVDSQGRIHLTLNNVNMNTPEIVFILDSDPAKNYPVLSYSINRPGQSSIVKTYEDYKLVSGKWIPATITIERYDTSKQSPELFSYDSWNFTSIRISVPHPASFRVPYESDALVEFYSPIINKPLSYRYYGEVDTDSLLQNRLAIVSAPDTQTQNCATVAMKYVSARLGKDVTDSRLAELINEPNEGTSLYKLRQFAQGLGFYCLAAKTDVTTLKNLNACQVILHLPGPNHFVVLEYIDDEYVWVIDLDSNKFFYRTKLDLFDLDWSEGTALLISNEPLTGLEGNVIGFADYRLREIIGGFPNYSCKDPIQAPNFIFCSEMIGGLCGGWCIRFYERYGCKEDPKGGSCAGSDLVGNASCMCIEDANNPGECVDSGSWYGQYIRACK